MAAVGATRKRTGSTEIGWKTAVDVRMSRREPGREYHKEHEACTSDGLLRLRVALKAREWLA